MRDVEGDFRAIASLLRVVDKPERDTACATISSIVLQLGAAAVQKNNKNARAQLKGRKELFRRVTIQQEGRTRTRISLFTVIKTLSIYTNFIY